MRLHRFILHLIIVVGVLMVVIVKNQITDDDYVIGFVVDFLSKFLPPILDHAMEKARACVLHTL